MSKALRFAIDIIASTLRSTVMNVSGSYGSVTDFTIPPGIEVGVNAGSYYLRADMDMRDTYVKKTHHHINTSEVSGAQAARELWTLSSLRGCPNVVQVKGIFFDFDHSEDVDPMSIIMSKAKFNLTDFLMMCRRCYQPSMCGKILRRVCHDILMGLASIHARGFIHRDVKPDNILVYDCMGSSMIGDLGSAIRCRYMRTSMEKRMTTYAFSSPEMLSSRSDFSYSTDIWSLGLTLYISLLILSHEPGKVTDYFSKDLNLDKCIDDVPEAILLYDGLEPFRSKGIDVEAIDEKVAIAAFGSMEKTYSLLVSMLRYDPTIRPTALGLLSAEPFNVIPTHCSRILSIKPECYNFTRMNSPERMQIRKIALDTFHAWTEEGNSLEIIKRCSCVFQALSLFESFMPLYRRIREDHISKDIELFYLISLRIACRFYEDLNWLEVSDEDIFNKKLDMQAEGDLSWKDCINRTEAYMMCEIASGNVQFNLTPYDMIDDASATNINLALKLYQCCLN